MTVLCILISKQVTQLSPRNQGTQGYTVIVGQRHSRAIHSSFFCLLEGILPLHIHTVTAGLHKTWGYSQIKGLVVVEGVLVCAFPYA